MRKQYLKIAMIIHCYFYLIYLIAKIKILEHTFVINDILDMEVKRLNNLNISRPLPSKKYLEKLGIGLYLFNFNNAFIIENMLNISDYRDWWTLIDDESGTIDDMINGKHYVNAFKGNEEILRRFHDLIARRNRIIHSFPITSYKKSNWANGQILQTKEKNKGKQFTITEQYLNEFICKNEKLESELMNFRETYSKK